MRRSAPCYIPLLPVCIAKPWMEGASHRNAEDCGGTSNVPGTRAVWGNAPGTGPPPEMLENRTHVRKTLTCPDGKVPHRTTGYSVQF